MGYAETWDERDGRKVRRTVHVTPSIASLAGYCCGCNNMSPHTPIWEVTLGSLKFRVCPECKNEMIDKLKK